MMSEHNELPNGQHEIEDFPRFGLTKFANRFPTETQEIHIDIAGDVERALRLSNELHTLQRVHQVSDFHCVTTWTKRNVDWSGYRFRDFYHELVRPTAAPSPDVGFVVFRCQDSYRVELPLEYALANDVILADTLNGQALPVAHGAPLRLVAPAHYGYKSAKHIAAIEFRRAERTYKAAGFQFMDHPRARVAHEERGLLLPGWVYRLLYRPLVKPTIAKFETALAERQGATGQIDSSDE